MVIGGIGIKDVSHQASDFHGDWAKKVPCRNATRLAGLQPAPHFQKCLADADLIGGVQGTFGGGRYEMLEGGLQASIDRG